MNIALKSALLPPTFDDMFAWPGMPFLVSTSQTLACLRSPVSPVPSHNALHSRIPVTRLALVLTIACVLAFRVL